MIENNTEDQSEHTESQNSFQKEKNVELKCENCKKFGHETRYCEKKYECLECGKFGHIEKFCFQSSERQDSNKLKKNVGELGRNEFEKKSESKKRKKRGLHEHDKLKKKVVEPEKKSELEEDEEVFNLKCENCFEFGHQTRYCKKIYYCSQCGEQGHIEKFCFKKNFCSNCKSKNHSFEEMKELLKCMTKLINLRL